MGVVFGGELSLAGISCPQRSFWIDCERERLFDRTVYQDNQVNEGSQVVKNPKNCDRAELLALSQRSAAHFSDEFFGTGSASSCSQDAMHPAQAKRVPMEAGGAAALEEAASKRRKVEVALAAPAAVSKQNTLFKACTGTMGKAKDAVAHSLDLEKETGVEDDRLQQSYKSTASIRHKMICLWYASTVAEANQILNGVASQVHRQLSSPPILNEIPLPPLHHR